MKRIDWWRKVRKPWGYCSLSSARFYNGSCRIVQLCIHANQAVRLPQIWSIYPPSSPLPPSLPFTPPLSDGASGRTRAHTHRVQRRVKKRQRIKQNKNRRRTYATLFFFASKDTTILQANHHLPASCHLRRFTLPDPLPTNRPKPAKPSQAKTVAFTTWSNTMVEVH